MSDLTAQEDDWYKSAKTPDDRFPESFFLAFKLTDKLTAHRRYGWTIERCCTDVDRKQRKEEFERWKSGKGASYWTDQRAQLSAIRTAGSLIEASEPYAEDSPSYLEFAASGKKMLIDTLSAPVHVLIVTPTTTSTTSATSITSTTSSTTPIGSSTITMQSGPLELNDLEPSLPEETSSAYTSTTPDASNTGTMPDPVPTISGEDDESLLIAEAEREALLALLSELDSIIHECELQGDEFLTCLFKAYQRLCATALHQNQLRISDVADVVALLGVLVPFKATERMKSIFPEKILDDLRRSDEEWPDVGFNENLVTSAVRDCMRGQRSRVSQLLRPLEKNHRRIKLLLGTRQVKSWRCYAYLEYLPLEDVKDLSEMDFVVKRVGPVMEAFIDSNRASSRFPNKDCQTQKRLNIKPDRPDLSVVVGETEVAFGEITVEEVLGYKDLDKNKKLLVQGSKG
ncbi:hypothetical protein BGX34_001344 [Mortierella sp. NVP85]|nr:hypothetical protein BGX34_001344 [Mortierella sp. NVP85]